MAETPARYCSNCGRELGDEGQFCPNCGSPVHQAATVPTPEADVPVPPPPQQQGAAGAQPFEQAEAQSQRRWWTTGRLVLGCFGVLFVLLLVGSCIAALAVSGGDGGDNNNGSGGGKNTTPKPKLAVSSPSESTTVTGSTFEVKGRVTPANSDVTVNGEGANPEDDGSFDALLALNIGENEIKVTATNGSKQVEYSRVVTRKLSEKEVAAKKAAEEAAAKKEEAAAKEAAEEAAAKKAAEEAAEAAKNASIGETVRVGDAEWTVTKARYATQLRQKGFGSFGDTKQGNFVVVDFTFTNQSNESVTLDTISLPLYDSKDRVYEADSDAFGYIPTEKDIFLTQVNPGVTQEGQIIYSVAPDASGFTLHAGDLEFFGADEAKIQLGF